jgi:hypothetical protein
MASRVKAVTAERTSDPALKEILIAGADGWWKDAEMFGVIGRVPDLLKSIVPVFVSFFGGGRIDAHLFELMRIKTGQINDCAY